MKFITLADFIRSNRDTIITRARERVVSRTIPLNEGTLEFGVPLFLTQLVEALSPSSVPPPDPSPDSPTAIHDSAGQHGQELLRSGFSMSQVVEGYGDVCQVVMGLAQESGAPISAQEFHVFNQCLDAAIASAVTAYGEQRERNIHFEGTERLGVLAHELRNLLNTAVLSFDAIKSGTVGLGGRTAAIHARSLAGLRALVDRSLSEVRLATGQARLERVLLADFIEEARYSATLGAEGRHLELTSEMLTPEVTIDADRQLLGSALDNLLQNAFKYSRAGGTVRMTTRVTNERVLIEVADECGGLPPGKVEELFRPFERAGAKGPGLGLGLSIALSAVRAHSGELLARDVPGTGCVFTISLPRAPA